MKQLLLLCTALLCACSKTKELPTKPKDDKIVRNLNGDWYCFQQKNTTNTCFYGINEPESVTSRNLQELFVFHTEDQEVDAVGGQYGRKVTKRNINKILDKLNPPYKVEEKIIFKVCISDVGEVIVAQLLNSESYQQYSEKQKKEFVKAISDYRFEANTESSCIECGKHTVSLKNMAN